MKRKLRVLYFPILCLLMILSNLGLVNVHAGAVSLEEYKWETINTNYAFKDIAFGNGKYVAITESKILYSTDLITWTEVSPTPTKKKLNAVSFLNGSFIIGVQRSYINMMDDFMQPQTPTILKSNDGITWEGVYNQETGAVFSKGALYNDNTYYMTIENGQYLFTSPNGSNWTKNTTALSGNYRYIAGVSYGNGLYVTGGWFTNDYTGVIRTSTDGVTWSAPLSTGTAFINSITNDGTKFIAVGNSGKIYKGTKNGSSLNISEVPSPISSATTAINSVTYGNGTFVAVCSSGEIVISNNGQDWVKEESNITTPLNKVLYANDNFIAVGNGGVFKRTLSAPISANANLSSLTISKGTIKETFTPDTTTYTANVGNDIDNVDLTVAVEDQTATVEINGGSHNQVNVPLNIGANTVMITVTAQNGTIKEYTITITRSSRIKGDANGDGIVTPADALIVYQYRTGKISLDDSQLEALDMNNDNVVDATDATLILQKYLQK